MSAANEQKGASVHVLYVKKKDARTVKVALEKEGLLNKQFRMTTNSLQHEDCIAIPITQECLEKEGLWTCLVVDTGIQACPYSSSVLGSHKNKQIPVDDCSSSLSLSTLVQRALYATLLKCSPQPVSEETKTELINRIQELSIKTCPKKLEVIGDDRTLVIPRTAFLKDVDKAFGSLLALVGCDNDESIFFWKHFGTCMGAPRVVRRGDIDPESSIRESGHVLLWPNHCGQPEETGESFVCLH